MSDENDRWSLVPFEASDAVIERPSSEAAISKPKIKAHQSTDLYPALSFIIDEVRARILLEKQSETFDSEMLGIPLNVIEDHIYDVAEEIGFELNDFEKDQILAILEKDNFEFGLLQELIEDPSISDIIVHDYKTITAQMGRKNIRSRLKFPSEKFYDAFVERLLAKAGTSISTKRPIADGMIGNNVRLHAVHKCLCESGPYLTIRINRYDAIDASQLIGHSAPQEIFDYLMACVRVGLTVMVVGEVGTGKTTLLRALGACIPDHESILVIEDTPEIKLMHPEVRYLRTRNANVEDAGRISASECIRAGMRMAMNRVIFGEIRTPEAAEAFIDVSSSGHPGLTTLHAKSTEEAITRLELLLARSQPGAAKEVLQRQIASSICVLVHCGVCPKGKRRVLQVKEISPTAGEQSLRHRILFEYKIDRWKSQSRTSGYHEELMHDPVFKARGNKPFSAEMECD